MRTIARENINAIYNALAQRTARIYQDARVLTGTQMSISVDCDGDVTISNVSSSSQAGGTVGSADAQAVIDFGNEDDKAKLQGLLSEGGQINQLLGRIGLEADVQQQILLGVSNEIWQTCVADAGSVVELAQRSSGDCTIEDVNISQTVDASLKRCLQMAAVTVGGRTCAGCAGGTAGECRNPANGACVAKTDGSCPDGFVDCQLQALDALLTSQAEKAAEVDEDAADAEAPEAPDPPCSGFESTAIALGVTIVVLVILWMFFGPDKNSVLDRIQFTIRRSNDNEQK